MARLTVRLFGPLQARVGEHAEPIQFSAQRTKSLLGFLLLHRETRHTRDRLATLWWGDKETQKARHSLNTELWRLRRALEPSAESPAPFLIVAPSEIGFNTQSSYWLDVEEFERLCALARQAQQSDEEAAGRLLQRAISLYRDDLLPECYEEWCLMERQRLQQLHLFALSWLSGYYARREAYTESIDCCQRILACDPLREEVHRDLIRLYLAAGRPQAAVQQSQLCASVLKREIGVEPMAETLALIQPLLAQAGAAAPSQPVSAAPARGDLQEILTHLSAAATTVALATVQIQQALHRVQQLVARVGGEPPDEPTL